MFEHVARSVRVHFEAWNKCKDRERGVSRNMQVTHNTAQTQPSLTKLLRREDIRDAQLLERSLNTRTNGDGNVCQSLKNLHV